MKINETRDEKGRKVVEVELSRRVIWAMVFVAYVGLYLLADKLFGG